MHQVKKEKSKLDSNEIQDNVTENISKEEVMADVTNSGASIFFIRMAICSIMIFCILFIKYIQPNTIFKEQIKKELTQTVTIEEVKQFICELEEMSDKYWRIK